MKKLVVYYINNHPQVIKKKSIWLAYRLQYLKNIFFLLKILLLWAPLKIDYKNKKLNPLPK